MPTYLFNYRVPSGYQFGSPTAVEEWDCWFAEMGEHVVDKGQPVFESTLVGRVSSETVPGGYTLVSAYDLATAAELAGGCPGLAQGFAIEVGLLTEVGSVGRVPSTPGGD